MGWFDAAVGIAKVGYSLYSSKKASDISDDNAKLADQEAEYQKEIAAINLAQHESDIKKLLGLQRSAYAVSGVDVTANGSVRDVIADSKREADFDAELIQRNAKIYESRYTAQASIARQQADVTRTTGYVNAGTTLLSNWGEDK